MREFVMRSDLTRLKVVGVNGVRHKDPARPRQTVLRRALSCVLSGALLLHGLASPQSALGQGADSARKSTASRHSPLFTATDLFVAGGFAATTIALFPVDEHLAKRLQNPGTQANRFLHHAATDFEWFGSTGPFIIGGSLYAIGMLGHHGELADLGWHGVEAAIVADGATFVLKGMLGRSRPFVSRDTSPRDFHFAGGFGKDDRRSFPSGHTTTAFAVAAAVTGEAQRHWPTQWWSTWLVAPAMYGGATMVGAARMYHNVHWASDVAMGAAIGTFTGRKLVQFNHAHPRNLIDRTILRTAVIPNGRGGYSVAWSASVP